MDFVLEISAIFLLANCYHTQTHTMCIKLYNIYHRNKIIKLMQLQTIVNSITIHWQEMKNKIKKKYTLTDNVIS